MLCVDLKLLLYVVNGILCIFAIFLISLGVYCTKIPGPVITHSSATIVIGAFMCLITIIGLIALKLNQFGLAIIYLILLICLIAADVSFGMRTLLINNELMIRSFLKHAYLIRSMQNSTNSGQVEKFQRFFRCCGYNGPNGTFILFMNFLILHFNSLLGKDVIEKSLIFLSEGNRTATLYNATFLIRECCPSSNIILCAKLDAYKISCMDKLIYEHREWKLMIGIFQLASSIILVLVTILGIKQMVSIPSSSVN